MIKQIGKSQWLTITMKLTYISILSLQVMFVLYSTELIQFLRRVSTSPLTAPKTFFLGFKWGKLQTSEEYFIPILRKCLNTISIKVEPLV